MKEERRKTRIMTMGDLVSWLDCVVKNNPDREFRNALLRPAISELRKCDPAETFKKCSRCGKIYPATKKYFKTKNDAKDKLQYKCRKCCNAYRRDYRHMTKMVERLGHTDIAEINRHRALRGEPPLPIPLKRPRGRPPAPLITMEEARALEPETPSAGANQTGEV